MDTTTKVASLSFTVSRNKNPRLPRGFWHQYGPGTSTWFAASACAKDLQLTYCGSMAGWTSASPPVKAWPQTNTASRTGTDHGGVLWRSNPVNEPFFISNILSLLRARATVGLGSLFRGWVCPSSRLFHTTLPSLLGNDLVLIVQPSLTSKTAAKPLVLSLSTSNARLCSSIFPTSPSCISL